MGVDGYLSNKEVDLTRPSCISWINATSEVYSFAMSIPLTPKGL